MINKEYFLSIVGPTASGKSNLAMKIAGVFKSCIISMDSMQIYKYLDIGSAKPSKSDQLKVKHEMIDILSPFDTFSVSNYIDEVKFLISKYNTQGVLPILTGGTALYLKSLIYNYSFSNVGYDDEYRKELYSQANNEDGKKKLLDILYKVDPVTAQKLHYNNVRRVIRALEIYKLSSKPMSLLNDNVNDDKYNYCIIGLNEDRSILYDKINRRVDNMVNLGLVDEVSMLINQGVTRDNQSMQGIGYKELIDYFDGKASLNECVDKIKQNSRRYAKRQITFFKSIKDIDWINIDQDKNYFMTAINIIKNSTIKDVLHNE